MKRTLITLPCLALAACAGSDETLTPESLTLAATTAGEVAIQNHGHAKRVVVSGDAAADLWQVMEDAGGFAAYSQNGHDYLLGQAIGCVTDGAQAACALVSRQAYASDEYQVTVHGPRFASAASELFGAIARASGTPPVTVTQVASRRFACAKNSTDVWCGLDHGAPDTATLELSFQGLEPLGPDFVYEGWLITSAGPVTSGRFDLTPGQPQTFAIDADVAADSTLFVLTIEPRVGDDPAPADTHVVAGALTGGTGTLTSDHPGALGTDFASASGGYILATPTAPMASYRQGIWFLDPGAGAASLTLPTLPAGWVYEGWVVGSDGQVSTGRFVTPAGADSDAAGPAAGPAMSPPFPGQDFITPPRDLVGHAVVISVEPQPDDSPAPFALKPLVDGSADDVGPGVLQSLAPNASAATITGVATLQ